MKRYEKLFLALAMVLVTSIAAQAQNVGINSTGNPPNSSAMLDVSAANKGLLIPNVALSRTTNASPITSPAVSLLVYNTATMNDVTPGYYYNSGTAVSPVWTMLLTTIADGSETRVTAGTNLTLTGSGTTVSPYVVSRSPGTTAGDIQYWNGTAWVIVPVGQPGQFLMLSASSIPTWVRGAILTTTAATAITETTATSGGNITSEGGGPVTVRGVCWSLSENPTISNSKTTDGSGTGTFTSNISGLTPGPIYYVRAYATNSFSTSYGEQMSILFQGLMSTTFTDVDANIYHAVVTGTQTWMVENLKTTKYRNNTAITNVTGNASWAALTTGAYCCYNNDAYSYNATYGAMYNWYAVADSRNIAPVGWHVATVGEWMTLIASLGGENVAAGQLKETGTSHWQSPNTGATNSRGFTALPGGMRYSVGTFGSLGQFGYYWTETMYNAADAFCIGFAYNSTMGPYYGSTKSDGFSVRCVRD